MQFEIKGAALAAGFVAFISLSFHTLAATPASQDVAIAATLGTTVYEWTGTAPAGASGQGSTCATYGIPDPSEDIHRINLTVPADLYDDHRVKADFLVEWDDPNGDLVLTLEKDGAHVADNDSVANAPEELQLDDPTTGAYDAVLCSYLSPLPVPYRATLTITVESTIPPPDIDADGVLNAVDACPATPAGQAVDIDGCPVGTASGLSPRFQIHVPPPGLGDDAGEPSIGFNKRTQHTMFIAYTQALRQTYQEDVVPPLLPASCQAIWEDKSGVLTTANTLDPILFTDEVTGRTFNSQLSGANSLFEFTDDDGDNWTPGQIAAPNGGADHQTVASGPYPADLVPQTASWPASGDKRAVYYCSQSVATAFCARSDDGGQTFGEGHPFKNLDCGVGALHGHVKVAPDGTVYVPDSSQCIVGVGTSGNVIVHKSEDAGLTWSVGAIESSEGGGTSDPSLGIATDGTLYMCYEHFDGTVHMAVSKDKGDTWINDRNVGVAHGIVQSRFPQAIAGDGDRAGCAFLGATLPGNGGSEDYEGLWYGYIATTYDEGDTYHVANVTPHDPVQGAGGVCGDGPCRNLLDFNDLQIDDEGRLLFAFADGCTGPCVQDPVGANTLEDKATIIRQSGGRTLFAAFDDAPVRFNTATAIEPAEACARQDLSSRNLLQANVVWSAPDTGGERITNYKVYRAESAAGPFQFLGDAGAALSYEDDTTRPSVEKYYYRVDAQNVVGTALPSNVVELAVTVEGSSCELPGIVTVVDTDDDSTTGTPAHEIESVHFAEPEAFGDKLVATLKVTNMDPATPNTMWAVRLEAPTDPENGEPGYWIGLSTADGGERWVHGTWRVDNAAAASVTVYTILGDIDPASNYTPEGVITLVADKALFGGLEPGDTIAGVLARVGPVSSNSSPIAGGAQDDTNTGFYQIQGAALCADPGKPLADLDASINEGNAPFGVEFAITGAHTKGKALVSYALNFGDGSAVKTGSFGEGGVVKVMHDYRVNGIHRAKLVVIDEVGTTSKNLAEETITVIGGEVAGAGDTRLGGALAPASVLLLGMLALLRRRGTRGRN